MGLFSKIQNGKVAESIFNKEKIINEIFGSNDKDCPGWNFLKIWKGDSKFDSINCDFLAIYTDVINKEIKFKSNPFSEYKRTVESIYQIVREIYITEDQYIDSDQLYKSITAKNAKELFIKLKKEQE